MIDLVTGDLVYSTISVAIWDYPVDHHKFQAPAAIMDSQSLMIVLEVGQSDIREEVKVLTLLGKSGWITTKWLNKIDPL